MSAIGGRPTPAPPRTPLIAWWVFPLCLLVFVATTTVPFGGAMSGLLSGHGFAWPAGPFGLGGYKALVMSPGDPAARWPSQPVPGGPVLTWICMAIGLIISGACAGIAESIAQNRAHRKKAKTSGLGDDRELLRLQMNEKGATERARNDFRSLQDRPIRSIDSQAAAVRLGSNVLTGTPIYLQHRDCVLCEAPTGAGKTSRVAIQRCWDAPGFLLATTTKRDLIASTWRYRSALGQAEIFDPEGLIGHPDPLRWSLLAGCDDEETAARRAEAWVKAVPMGDTKDSSFWEGKAKTLMRCYLHAAAHRGKGLAAVCSWVTNRRASEPLEILDSVNPAWAAEIRQIVEAQSDSSDDMFHAVATLVEPLSNPRLLAAVDTPADESVDLEQLVLGGPNTLYLVSKGTSGSVAPIVAVFAAEVYHILDRASLRTRRERLDPPARLVLDEVNTVAPIPGLPNMMNDTGGRGISIWAFAHNKAQNIQRWGNAEGELFTDSAPVRLILPGLSGDRELAELSRLCGTIDEYEPITDPTHTPRLRTRNVMEPSDIRQMPTDHALLVARGAAPFVVHLPTVWENKPWRKEVDASKALFDKVAPLLGSDGDGDTDVRVWA